VDDPATARLDRRRRQLDRHGTIAARKPVAQGDEWPADPAVIGLTAFDTVSV
jgi:hypothetical protein